MIRNSAVISVDTDKPVAKVSRHIYGHFIEHLGRCIYGGIWAEMLVNRKFAGHDTKEFGVLDPWCSIGRDKNSRFMHDNTAFFSGNQSQKIEILEDDGKERGIGQGELALKNGASYELTVWVKKKGKIGTIACSLRKGKTKLESNQFKIAGNSWKKLSCSLKSSQTTSKGVLAITTTGKGKLWVGAASLMPSENTSGMRPEVLEAIIEMNPPNVRWPGGNFVSGYNWLDGIGPKDKRPTRWDRAWDATEYNDFGVDEFIKFCRLIDAEPYICVNTGDGTAEGAAALVEYCNGPASSKYGALRAKNGHRKPYGVRLWGVGNEIYGNWQIGHVDAETYGRMCLEFIEAMRHVDKSIEFISIGQWLHEDEDDWNRHVLELTQDQADYFSVHEYTDQLPGQTRPKNKLQEEALYWHVVLAPEKTEAHFKKTGCLISKTVKVRPDLPIAFDEWNVWIRDLLPDLEQEYKLRDGLYAAGMFHAMQRMGDRVKIANLAQLVNVLGALRTDKTRVAHTPISLAFKLYAEHSGDTAVMTRVDGPAKTVSGRKADMVDAQATVDSGSGKVYIGIVNRSIKESMECRIHLENVKSISSAEAHILAGPSYTAMIDIGGRPRVRINKKKLRGSGNNISLTLPRHSVAVVVVST
ncbi:alpha-L-arabinofuranosidase C-terminal domain-containing protein [Candidatus Hydrogenedentota bacterium]